MAEHGHGALYHHDHEGGDVPHEHDLLEEVPAAEQPEPARAAVEEAPAGGAPGEGQVAEAAIHELGETARAAMEALVEQGQEEEETERQEAAADALVEVAKAAAEVAEAEADLAEEDEGEEPEAPAEEQQQEEEEMAEGPAPAEPIDVLPPQEPEPAQARTSGMRVSRFRRHRVHA